MSTDDRDAMSTGERDSMSPDDRNAMSIPEFCHRHRISRYCFYDLLKRGKAPRSMKVGRRRIISKEAAAEWRRQMESEE